MLHCTLLAVIAVWGQAGAAAEDGLQATVDRLLLQLNARQLVRREAAEEQLLELGPEVLDLLPPPAARMTAEVQQRVQRVRQKLQRLVAESVASASPITLSAEAMPLSQVLSALREQSGNKIVDFRERFGHGDADPRLKVDLDKTPFWQALDRVLDQAELTVYAFGEERAVNVVAREKDQLPRSGSASYSGPFRIEPIRILARRELHDPEGQLMQLTLEVAWEPRLKPICLVQRMEDLRAVDENGEVLPLDDRQAELEVPAGDATTIELLLPLELPPRRVQEIASLKGRLTAMIPGKVETFTFDNVTQARNVEKKAAGVTVTLSQVRKNNELWEVRMRVRFDRAGGALQSHRGWIFDNEAFLQDADGKPIPYDTTEVTGQSEDELGIAFLFFLDHPPDGFRFVYKTPGTVVATTFDYEIKGVKLP